MSATSTGGETALAFGANGISGTASVTQFVQTSTSEWSQIIAISRQFAKIVIDHDVKEAYHAFYYTYLDKPAEQKLLKVNLELLSKTLEAVAAALFVEHGDDAPRLDKDSNSHFPQEDLTK
ncbi:hypothetical protein BDB00DRAFT_869409 [Zychaea mexicana]|uniref:uncharacterized protein n=1 Tax=Zychaea mexicana TaxID=64656 RepID=UPI0022FE5E48|nr:uncharacterized protein BDB00DRAFT_869409 [Zychaea mexicana]KAI9496468.1 hypothetical protein BDB00DRAFT_869409 [Zychaea mexicana]